MQLAIDFLSNAYRPHAPRALTRIDVTQGLFESLRDEQSSNKEQIRRFIDNGLFRVVDFSREWRVINWHFYDSSDEIAIDVEMD